MSDTKIDISGLSRAAVLAALYNASKAQGMGFLQPGHSQSMTEVQATELLGGGSQSRYFDYLQGRVMKVEIPAQGDENPSIETWLYDRDNGAGAAARVIASLRSRG